MLKAVSGKKIKNESFSLLTDIDECSEPADSPDVHKCSKMRTVRTWIRVTLSGVTPVSADEDFQAMEYPVTQVKTRTSYYERIKLGKV